MEVTESKKIICVATPLYPPQIGGPATYAKELVRGLPDRGVEVSLLKFSDVCHWYLPKLVRHYVYYRKALGMLKNADGMLALDPVSVGLPAMKAARKIGKPFVVKIVGDYAWEQGVQRFGVDQTLDDFVKTKQQSFFVRKLQSIQLQVASAAAHVIVPSDYLKDIVTQWGIPPAKILVINNGIEIPEHIPVQERKSGEFLIVSAGRRVPWKGFEAIERMKKTHPDWVIKILSTNTRDEVLGWIRAANVFVLNSEYEGFPHVLVEAMTLGTPVVVTDIRANKSIVEGNGLLVAPRDDVALEKALIEVEKNPHQANERARAGQEHMKSFELSYMLDRTAEFLKTL